MPSRGSGWGKPNFFNLSGSNSPPLGAIDFAVFGFDTPLLAAGFFISVG